MNQPIGSATNFEVKKEFNEFLYNEIIKKLDAKVESVYQTKDLISGRLDYGKVPYEIIIGAPQTMGERGFNISIYYNELPSPEGLFNDLMKEMKEITKKEVKGGVYDEERMKIFKKLLRNNKCYNIQKSDIE